MDPIDQKILKELQLDGRLTNHELSDRVGLSPSPCLRRVRALEKAGVINGYSANLNQEACGFPINAFVSVRLDKPNDEVMKKFEKGIQSLSEVLECYLITGTQDYLLRVVARSLKSYESFMRNELTKLPHIQSIESSFAFGQVKQQTVLPTG
jgi:Lrp/AsnC family leucine-responsive transcriptional regulator